VFDVCCVGIEDETEEVALLLEMEEVVIVLEVEAVDGMLEEVVVWFAYPMATRLELRKTPEWSKQQFGWSSQQYEPSEQIFTLGR